MRPRRPLPPQLSAPDAPLPQVLPKLQPHLIAPPALLWSAPLPGLRLWQGWGRPVLLQAQMRGELPRCWGAAPKNRADVLRVQPNLHRRPLAQRQRLQCCGHQIWPVPPLQHSQQHPGAAASLALLSRSPADAHGYCLQN